MAEGEGSGTNEVVAKKPGIKKRIMQTIGVVGGAALAFAAVEATPPSAMAGSVHNTKGSVAALKDASAKSKAEIARIQEEKAELVRKMRKIIAERKAAMVAKK